MQQFQEQLFPPHILEGAFAAGFFPLLPFAANAGVNGNFLLERDSQGQG